MWTIGIVGTALGLISSVWLTRFAELMMWLGAVLVPVGGVFLAHFVVMRKGVNVDTVYRIDTLPALNVAGGAAWMLACAYKLATPFATLPPWARRSLCICVTQISLGNTCNILTT